MNNVYKYRGTNIEVEFPLEYKAKEREFRGVWLTSYIDDFKPSPNKEEMMKELTSVLNKMKEYNLNAVIFHVRCTNNSFYKSKRAPIDKNYGTYESFDEWDYLKWFIEECHKNNMEFHAWLNPYRIKSYGFNSDVKKSEIAELYKDYPLNPASKEENILLTYLPNGNHGAVLNPCKEEVQQHIIDVCLEIMENYDVDGIHFDDYFYAKMSDKIEVLIEEDQQDYIEYVQNNPDCKYDINNALDKKNWRRDNINTFIYNLHIRMKEFNEKNNRNVQLGISPTGIYKNGDGSVESGSNTLGQEHYESYLFCDSLKWVKEEWIDYIIPQTYWAFGHPVAGYADISEWWNKAVEGTNVKLYLGMGIYMANNPNSFSWAEEGNYEASNQVLYNCKLKNVLGTCIFDYRDFKVLEDENCVAHNGFKKLKEEYWKEFVHTPNKK